MLYNPETQPAKVFIPYPDSVWMRALYKAPLWLWRLGFGPLLGHIFVVITTRGRKSGLPRRVVTEYVPYAGKLYTINAFGERSQWYRNLQADPRVTIQTWQGAERVVATRVTDIDELLAVFAAFRRRNPVTVDAYFHDLGIGGDPASIREHHERVYLLRFDPATEAPPLPLDADLAWLWAALLALVLILRPRRRK